jgi:hypothetical protein
MAQDPREAWQRLQRTIQQRGRAGFSGGFPGGNAGKVFGPGIIAVVIGGFILSNSLFNGILPYTTVHAAWTWLTYLSRRWSQSYQIHENKWCEKRVIQ